MFLLTYFPIHNFIFFRDHENNRRISLDCILQNYIHIKIERYNNLNFRQVLVSLVQQFGFRTWQR